MASESEVAIIKFLLESCLVFAELDRNCRLVIVGIDHKLLKAVIRLEFSMQSRIFGLLIGTVLMGLASMKANEVLLVLGSDTGIWEGLNTNTWANYYQADLYTDKTMNTYNVMAPEFREPLIDFYGTPMKITWWMMAGNMFRYGTNLDIPNVNSMPFYLMQHYHGQSVAQWGDEISLHYHTFYWSDYDGDGVWWWNQAKGFNDSREDFDFTLRQVLLDEEIFPVSFRSGWHYMDNVWQNYIDSLWPYSMHNDHPNKRDSDPEPIDNIYDWSKSPSTFVPYHPAVKNYQIRGTMKGWNLRSAHIGSLRYQAIMDTLFMQAKQGKRQMACLWGHLPETDFLTNLQMIDSLAHAKSKQYGNIPFRYCSAVEAMQRWVNTSDSIAPIVTYQIIPYQDSIQLEIRINEPIFQLQPFVAWKSIRQEYHPTVLDQVSEGIWRTGMLPAKGLAKLAIACCDTVGNQTKVFYRPLPEDIYLDDASSSFEAVKGAWQTVLGRYWDCSAGIVTLNTSDSAGAQFCFQVPQNGVYSIYWLPPSLTKPVTESRWSITVNQQSVKELVWDRALTSDRWLYVATLDLNLQDQVCLHLMAGGAAQIGSQLGVDAVKISAMVGRKHVELIDRTFNLDVCCQYDTVIVPFTVLNKGLEVLQISAITSLKQKITCSAAFPLTINPGDHHVFSLQIDTRNIGSWDDSLVFLSDDDVAPRLTVPCHYQVEPFFVVIDNEDSSRYKEKGKWQYSVAWAYKSTSRYASINQNPLASVEFTAQLRESGIYDIRHIVPTTVNASDKAIYTVLIDQKSIDTIWVDQNTNSGSWNTLGRWTFSANTPITLRISDSGKSKAGVVLRADAVKFAKVDPATLVTNESRLTVHPYLSLAVFPNPFHQLLRGRIYSRYTAPAKLNIYNTLGQSVESFELSLTADSPLDWSWTPDHLPSGIYFLHLYAFNHNVTVKTLYLK